MNNSRLKKIDKECLKKTIDIAKEVLEKGINYPVGAVLSIDGKIIDAAGNEINRQKALIKHAENILIIRNSKKIFKAAKKNKEICLYSTLEPCIQCLGACVTNKVNKIFIFKKIPTEVLAILNMTILVIATKNFGRRLYMPQFQKRQKLL